MLRLSYSLHQLSPHLTFHFFYSIMDFVNIIHCLRVANTNLSAPGSFSVLSWSTVSVWFVVIMLMYQGVIMRLFSVVFLIVKVKLFRLLRSFFLLSLIKSILSQFHHALYVINKSVGSRSQAKFGSAKYIIVSSSSGRDKRGILETLHVLFLYIMFVNITGNVC